MANSHGDYIWYELLTSDADGAQSFYAKVVGWTAVDSGMPDMDYRILSAGESQVAGLMAITPEMAGHGARPAWLGYVAVDDVDKCVESIEHGGGKALMPAMDVPEVGRIAMVADPQGAPFYIMKPASPEDTSLAFAYDVPRDGHCAWNELMTSDQEGAWHFYGTRFGWVKEGEMDMGPMGTYDFIRHSSPTGGMLGAIMTATDEMGSRWNQYFRVPDIDAAKQTIEANGGSVVNGPMEIPGGDYALNGVDPQGAPFGLVGPRKQ